MPRAPVARAPPKFTPERSPKLPALPGSMASSSVAFVQVMLLVCGSGQPRDMNADPHSNSTEATAQIVEKFVELCYPDIEVRGKVFQRNYRRR